MDFTLKSKIKTYIWVGWLLFLAIEVGIILEVSLVSLLCPSNNNVALKIII
jgi:hypothetical protein